MNKKVGLLKDNIDLLNNILKDNQEFQKKIDMSYINIRNELDTILIVIKEIKEDKSKFIKDKSINNNDIKNINKEVEIVEKAKEIELDNLEKELEDYEINHKKLKDNSFEIKRR